jgi:transcriptional regulator with XRE-family HTH domain
MTEREFNGEALGNRIKLLRALRRMSLDEVGQAAGLTKSHVWELEQGRSRNPTVNAVWGLARALSVSPATILGLDDTMPPIHPLALEIAGMVDRAIRSPEGCAIKPAADGEVSKRESARATEPKDNSELAAADNNREALEQ